MRLARRARLRPATSSTAQCCNWAAGPDGRVRGARQAPAGIGVDMAEARRRQRAGARRRDPWAIQSGTGHGIGHGSAGWHIVVALVPMLLHLYVVSYYVPTQYYVDMALARSLDFGKGRRTVSPSRLGRRSLPGGWLPSNFTLHLAHAPHRWHSSLARPSHSRAVPSCPVPPAPCFPAGCLYACCGHRRPARSLPRECVDQRRPKASTRLSRCSVRGPGVSVRLSLSPCLPPTMTSRSHGQTPKVSLLSTAGLVQVALGSTFTRRLSSSVPAYSPALGIQHPSPKSPCDCPPQHG